MRLTIILFSLFILLHLITVLLARSVWKRTGKAYRPMLLFFGFNFLLECIKSFIPGEPFILVKTETIQTLMSVLLVLWQAKEWNVFEHRPRLFSWLQVIAVTGCLADQVIFRQRPGSELIFFICSAFGITLLAIEMLNRNLPQNPVAVWRNPVFLFCTGLIFHFTMLGLLGVFSHALIESGQAILNRAYYFYSGLSIIIQFLYIRSVLCIPAKDNYYSY